MSLFVWNVTLDLSSLGDPTRSYDMTRQRDTIRVMFLWNFYCAKNAKKWCPLCGYLKNYLCP